MTQTEGSRRGVMPAQCAGCGAKSEPRPLGQTPDGWGRETKGGNGKYFCPGCAPIWEETNVMRPSIDDFEAMHAQPGGAYAESCRQIRDLEAEVERLRDMLGVLHDLILHSMPAATNQALAADGPVGDEEERCWSLIESTAREQRDAL